jgi:hypothetical protein
LSAVVRETTRTLYREAYDNAYFRLEAGVADIAQINQLARSGIRIGNEKLGEEPHSMR